MLSKIQSHKNGGGGCSQTFFFIFDKCFPLCSLDSYVCDKQCFGTRHFIFHSEHNVKHFLGESLYQAFVVAHDFDLNIKSSPFFSCFNVFDVSNTRRCCREMSHMS